VCKPFLAASEHELRALLISDLCVGSFFLLHVCFSICLISGVLNLELPCHPKACTANRLTSRMLDEPRAEVEVLITMWVTIFRQSARCTDMWWQTLSQASAYEAGCRDE